MKNYKLVFVKKVHTLILMEFVLNILLTLSNAQMVNTMMESPVVFHALMVV